MDHLCIFGTYLDPAKARSHCQSKALDGSDYCGAHLAAAGACVVRCCVGFTETGNKGLCPEHKKTFIAEGLRGLAFWLASRPNPIAARLAELRAKEDAGSLPGFFSLGASAILLSVLGLGGAIYTQTVTSSQNGNFGLAVGAGIVFFFWAALAWRLLSGEAAQ